MATKINFEPTVSREADIRIVSCGRCTHKWATRLEFGPKHCPGCKTPYWNKNRVRKVERPLRQEGTGERLCTKCGHRLWYAQGVTTGPYWRHYSTDYKNPKDGDKDKPDTGPCYCGCNHRIRYRAEDDQVGLF